MVLAGERILLGITGGIAAYKCADFVRRMKQAGAEVRVVMTDSAEHFITATTLQALSGNAVRNSLWDENAEAAMSHIELARWASKIIIAPASADFIARLASGQANDLLSTLCLASKAPLFVAPAMNQAMWANAATQNNISVLAMRGGKVLGPASGEQACGEVGEGRMLEPGELLQALVDSPKPWAGKLVVITAGPTFEDIDPVRFIGNRSSGKMGFAIAQAAMRQGAKVLLIAGPVSLPELAGIRRINVRSAQQMLETVQENLDECDVFIGAAAVADYRVAEPSSQKLKKTDADLQLILQRTPDILASVASSNNRPPLVVGFAAETQNMEQSAQNKLREKRVDVIAANDVSQTDIGFESDDNALTVFTHTQRIVLNKAPKRLLAEQLLDILLTLPK